MAAILLYHSVASEVRDAQLQIAPSTLVRHLQWCQDLGYEVASLSNVLKYSSERLVAVTFDDGFASIQSVWPELKRRGIRPSVFLCPGMVGRENHWASAGRVRERLLDVRELQRLRDEGMLFACHGWDHRPFVGRTRQDMAKDLRLCEAWFQSSLGVMPREFAWPFGHFDEAAIRAVGQDFEFALAIEPAWNEEVRPLALPRAVGTDSLSQQEFADELELKLFVLDPEARRPFSFPTTERNGTIQPRVTLLETRLPLDSQGPPTLQ